MRRIALTFLSILLVALPLSSASGQQDLVLEQLTVSFWPEYDQPAVLVIYQAQLPQDTSLPATIQLPLPEGVSSPHAVANTSEAGSLVNAEYRTVSGERGRLIEVTAESSTVWVEYYQELQIEGDSRSFDFQWPGIVGAAEFAFEVQQPLGAEDLSISPAPNGQRLGPDGLTYRTGSFGPVQPGEEVELELSYQNPDGQLSVGAQPEIPLEGVSTSPPESTGGVNWLVPALAGLGIILLAVAGIYLWQQRKQEKATARPRRRRAPAKPSPTKFCHQCGEQVTPRDKFCRHCGAEQRSS